MTDYDASGSRTSRYRILGLVGMGGMGVVYRAEDTWLGRIVALKFLLPLQPPSPQAKARLLDEARAAAALDHPNICTIYEVEETPDEHLYLAMAFYEGETLKSRLERGPLRVAEALPMVLQVARGLDKAHRSGILHRDIKPANLMITTDGIVKILDFGIAQLPGQATDGPLLGTPAYMSPEQARGGEVDARSDLWSLGAVLHEMLTGRPPGCGEEIPEPWLRRKVPTELHRVVSRMLSPEPEDRYQDATALLADLSALELTGRTGRAWWWRLLPLAAVLATLTPPSESWLLQDSGRRPAAGPHPGQISWALLTPDLPGKEESPSLSPDGSFFLYARKFGGRSRLFLQRVGGSNPIDLLPDSLDDDTQPVFSPDGQQIAFRSERDGGGIFVMGATGESVRRVTDFGFHPAWSPDGDEIAFATERVVDPRIRRQRSALFRVHLTTGEQHQVNHGDAVQPSWSPHGFRIAYWELSPSGQRVIWTLPSGGGEPLRVTDGSSLDWHPVWSPDGHSLYFASDRSGVMNLWWVPIEERSGRVLAAPEPVTSSSQALSQFSLAADGRRVLYACDTPKTIFEKFAFDPVRGTIESSATPILETTRIGRTLDVSRDGQWLVFQTFVPDENLFLARSDGSGLRQLTRDKFKNRHPRLSPDGTRIAFHSNRGGKYDIWTLHADGSRLEPVTAVPHRQAFHPVWSPDGARITCYIEENGAVVDLTRPMPERNPRLLPSPGPGLAFSASSWSADGVWLAGVLHRKDGSRYPGIVLHSLASKRYMRITDRGEAPAWFSDSRRLIYWDDGEIFLLDTRNGKSQPILSTPPGSDYSDLTLSADDRILYVVRNLDEGDVWLLTLQ